MPGKETAGPSRDGLVVGTVAYMSPEQTRGQDVDTRSDIWAFGCVLDQMLTGKRAFGGDTLTDVMAAVVKNQPDWQALPAEASLVYSINSAPLSSQGRLSTASAHR